MNETAPRGLLSVSFFLWLPLGFGEDLDVMADGPTEGDASVLAAEGRRRWPSGETDDEYADSCEKARDPDHEPTLNQQLTAAQDRQTV